MLDTIEIGGFTWSYRPETSDLGIIKQSFLENSCRLPDDLTGKHFVDIGAHIGAVSVLAAQRGAKVIAFEPSTGTYPLLVLNLLRNFPVSKAIQQGVGHPGTRRLYLDPYNTGQDSAFLLYPELNENRFELIEMISINNAIGFYCDFLKIDCEGCEEEVLEQLLMLRNPPKTISVEFHRPDRPLVDRLRDRYNVEQISNDGYLLELKA